jgi:hypothetical protein
LTDRITGSTIKHARIEIEAKNITGFFMDIALLGPTVRDPRVCGASR